MFSNLLHALAYRQTPGGRYFKKWKDLCAKSLRLKRVKEIIRAMILGNAVSINFGMWKDIWRTNKDKEVKVSFLAHRGV